MSISNRLFSDAVRDMQRAMAYFEQPFFNASSAPFFRSHSIRYPSADMVETPNAFELHAELPGYDKKDIKIELSDSHTLVISGNVEKEYKTESPSSSETDASDVASSTPTSENQWLVQERTSGSFVRSFTLPIAVKPDTIKASYNNGILKVVVPKAENKQTSRITID
ncbi:HSP20-like chaperone [Parasitella parasitica]|nr:HSP20-like chaperone [Parasitella parasitica]